MPQFPALLTINQGEGPYKCAKTGWLVDSDGPVMFRFISKLRQDGDIELVLFTQRADNRKYVLEHISFKPDEFPGVVNVVRETVWKFFPDAKIEIEDFAEIEPENYQALPNTKLNLWWLKSNWFFKGLINKLRWLFFRQPPK